MGYIQTNSPTILLAATSSSGSITIPEHSRNTREVVIYNAGSVDVFITSGTGSATAADPTSTISNNVPIPAGQSYTMNKPPEHDTIAAKTSSGTANVYITLGGE